MLVGGDSVVVVIVVGVVINVVIGVVWMVVVGIIVWWLVVLGKGAHVLAPESLIVRHDDKVVD